METYDLNLTEYMYTKGMQNSFESLEMSDRLSIIEKIGNGLDYIHNTIKATHFDLKFDNIMINIGKNNYWDQKTVKIIDFGYCCSKGAHQTRAGTPGWASPEQCIDKADKKYAYLLKFFIFQFDNNLQIFYMNILG